MVERNKKWLNKHFKEFVRPVVKDKIPKAEESKYLFFPENNLKQLLSCWKQAKEEAKGKEIVLPGRDAYLFEVLARLENYPTVFLPEYSALVADALNDGKIKVPDDYSERFGIDSGYGGTVLKALGVGTWKLCCSNKFSFKGHSICGPLEGSPKYWERAVMRGKKIYQPLASLEQFRNAALLTRKVALFALDHPEE